MFAFTVSFIRHKQFFSQPLYLFIACVLIFVLRSHQEHVVLFVISVHREALGQAQRPHHQKLAPEAVAVTEIAIDVSQNRETKSEQQTKAESSQLRTT